MARKAHALTPEQVKDAADRAEGLATPKTDPEPILGRPPSYNPAFADQARRLCQMGLTDQEIADFFEISVRTLHRWKAKYEDFCHALKPGKDVADDRIERSLYHRATGYTFEAEEVFQYQGEVVRAKVMKHVPPDATSMIFWLKNRRPKEWRDVQRHELGGVGAFDEMSDAELRKVIAEESPLIDVTPTKTNGTGH